MFFVSVMEKGENFWHIQGNIYKHGEERVFYKGI